MSARYWLQKLAVVVLCGAVLLGAAGKSWCDFYVIPVTSMTFKGDWDVNTVYNAKDVVFYDGSSWFSLARNNQGHTPAVSSAYWTLVAKKGDPGPSKVLKTQVFSYSLPLDIVHYDPDLNWTQLTTGDPWNYLKVSDTSQLIITYQESLRTDNSGPTARFEAMIRANGDVSDTGPVGFVCTSATGSTYSATGLWSHLRQGNVALTLWGWVSAEADTGYRNIFSVGRCQVLVMEVEP